MTCDYLFGLRLNNISCYTDCKVGKMKYFVVIYAVLLLLNAAMAQVFSPPSFNLPKPPKLVVNKALVDVEILYADNGLAGLPVQSLVTHGSILYAAAADGWVYAIEDGNVKPLASVSPYPSYCVAGKVINPTFCGQPRGMRMGPKGVHLYIADAHYGLVTINRITGVRTLLFALGTPVGGVPTKFFEDLAVTSKGVVYIAEDSTKWGMSQLMTLTLEAGKNGRVIKIKPGTRMRPSVVIDGIASCASVHLTPDEKSILISELTRARIKRHYIRGRKKGKTVTFADNLPGFPANIRSSSRGGYWVALPIVRDQSIFETIDSLPAFRSAMRKQLTDAQLAAIIVESRGMVVELSRNGQVLRTLQDLADEKIGIIEEVNDNGRELHFGAFMQPGIARLTYPIGCNI